MFLRIYAIGMNTYREAVRARILHGLLGLAVLTLGYSLVVGAYALGNQARVVANVGSAAISLFGLVVAILLAGTSLYRELELKTIFPILARPLRRWEFLLGKYVGILITLLVFIAINSGLLLTAEGVIAGRSLVVGLSVPGALALGTVLYGIKKPSRGTWLPVPVAALILGFGIWFASDVPSYSRIIIGQSIFSCMELCIVAALTMVFASFSSPFLTAIFSICIIIIGRSADTLARLPEHMFGSTIKALGQFLARIFPNLMVYVPPRAVLAGESPVPISTYFFQASTQALAWTVLLLALSVLVFRKRDFL
ncbi:MAG: hypothetical protein MK135_10815 [Polyangiaceae bacterium]|nr:hypothetical protein [Polyangiaceae bacterium]